MPKRRWRTRAERQAWYEALRKEGCVITSEPLKERIARAKAEIRKQRGIENEITA